MIVNTHYSYFDEPCLTFSSVSPFSITIPSTSTYEGSLYYSTDRFHWNICTKGDTLNSSSNGKLFFRGVENTSFCQNNRYLAGASSGNITTDSWLYSGNDYVDVIGNIETLLDYRRSSRPDMSTRCFCLLFYNWDKLRTAPVLNATTLAERCYAGMFYKCASLTVVPATLPATTLAVSCYEGMFQGCTSLTTAPSLPATTLARACYNYMFVSCTSLTTAPSLPATTLAESCYLHMFTSCHSLTAAPALPATTLAANCYDRMFMLCRGLTTAPSTLPATTLAERCYSQMFCDCTSLTTAPSLPATTLAANCYSSMFSGCTSLTTAPSLPATTLTDSCYAGMFYDCISLTTIPRLSATSVPYFAYGGMFHGCSNIKISQTQTSTYSRSYYIGTPTDTAWDSFRLMFSGTGGSFTGTPTGNTTYYTSNNVV